MCMYAQVDNIVAGLPFAFFMYGSYEVVGVYGSYVQHVHVGGINVYIGIST